MDGIQLSQGSSHYEETVYFLPLRLKECLVLIWSTSEGWKAESTLVPLRGFEPETPRLRIQRPNHCNAMTLL